MKTFLALFLVAILVVSTSVLGFSASVFDFNSYLFSDILPDTFSQFHQENGKYIIPLDLTQVSKDIDDLYSYFNNSSYIPFYSFDSSSGQVYLRLYFLPRSNYKFVKYRDTNNLYNFGFFYNNYVRSFYIYSVFVYDSSQNVFSPISFLYGSHVLSSSYLKIYNNYQDFSNVFYYFPDNSLFSSISDSYISEMAGLNFVSDSPIFSFVDASSYVPPVSKGNTLAINYQYSNGTPAADSVTQSLAPGTEYSILSPDVTGYTPDIPLVTGTMPEEDLTVTVTYAKAFYPLTVQYQYTDGSQAAESVSFQYPLGFVYDIPSPEIEGYQPDKPTIAGEMPGEALEEVVTYSAIPYTLTVQYLFTDGSQAAPDHQEQLTIGSSYSVPSPVLEGYHPNQTAVTGIMPASDVVSTVTYREDSGGSSGPGSSGPGEGGDPGGEGPGGGGGSGDDPFIPTLPPFSGNDPFVIPGIPDFSGYDPFVISEPPGYSGYDPFRVPQLPRFSGYDPFKMPERGGS